MSNYKLTPKIPMEEWAIKPSQPDSRDYTYTLKVANPLATINRPKRVINKRRVVRDQGGKGACGGFAGANAKDKRENAITSPLYLYQMAKSLDNFPGEEGTDMRTLMSVLLHHGICLEALHPYESYVNNPPLQFPEISEAALQDASKRKIEAYARVLTKDELLDAIYKYMSVMAGMIVATNFFYPEKNAQGESFIDIPEGYILGGHAVDFAGYDEDLSFTYKNGITRKGFVLCDNSHGPDYGTNGSVWVPFDYVFGKLSDFNMSYVMDMFCPIDIFEWKKEVKTMDEPPLKKGNRIFVPTRAVGEGLGAQVNWNEAEPDKVEFVLDDKKVEVFVGKAEYNVYTKGQ